MRSPGYLYVLYICKLLTMIMNYSQCHFQVLYIYASRYVCFVYRYWLCINFVFLFSFLLLSFVEVVKLFYFKVLYIISRDGQLLLPPPLEKGG